MRDRLITAGVRVAIGLTAIWAFAECNAKFHAPDQRPSIEYLPSKPDGIQKPELLKPSPTAELDGDVRLQTKAVAQRESIVFS